MRTVITAAALVFAALPAIAQERPAPAYEVTGEARNCIPASSIRSYTPIDSRTLYVTMRGNTDYRSDLPQECGYQPKTEALIMRQVTGSVCAGDFAQRQILSDRIYRGHCVFGPFTPVKRVKKP